MSAVKIFTHELSKKIPGLKSGDSLLLSGVIYTARDAAHKRIFELLDAGADLPFDISSATIYYAGPTPPKPGMAVGSCGPTTSSRMDLFTPRLLDLGLVAMIGKGARSEDVVNSIVKNGAVYFSTIGGAGALIAKCVKSSEVIAFPELLSESVKRLVVEDLPVFVAIDPHGGNLYSRDLLSNPLR